MLERGNERDGGKVWGAVTFSPEGLGNVSSELEVQRWQVTYIKVHLDLKKKITITITEIEISFNIICILLLMTSFRIYILPSLSSYRRLQRVEEESQRKFHALEERLDSTVQRYEEEISYLRSQKARLEEQLDMERNSNYSTLAVLACMLNYHQHSPQLIYSSGKYMYNMT